MPAAGELASQRKGREGVPGVTEGGEQYACWIGPPAQSISANSRTVRFRTTGSGAMTEAISVPTPASR
jgi:hypothetical protein